MGLHLCHFTELFMVTTAMGFAASSVTEVLPQRGEGFTDQTCNREGASASSGLLLPQQRLHPLMHHMRDAALATCQKRVWTVQATSIYRAHDISREASC